MDFLYETDPLFNAASTAVEAVSFMSSNVGKALLQKAAYELREAQMALEVVDVTDTKTITQLQSQAYRARNFIQWLKNIVVEGRVAEANMKIEESYDN